MWLFSPFHFLFVLLQFSFLTVSVTFLSPSFQNRNISLPLMFSPSPTHRIPPGSLAQRWPKLCTKLCTYPLWNAKPALSREVQHMRSFSGLTAAFVSHYIWSKYMSAPLEKIKPNQNKKQTTTSEKQKATQTGRQNNNFQWERLGELILLRVL